MRSTAIVLAAALAAVPCLSARGDDEKKPSPRPKRVYTEDDLRGAGRPRGTVSQPGSTSDPDPSVSPSPDASPSPGASPEPTEDEKRAKAAKRYQVEIDHYAKEIATRRASIEKAQLELNDLTNYTFGGRRQTLSEQIEVWKSEIAQAEQEIAKLEEQARREGARVARP
jgi:hypothetical protein